MSEIEDWESEGGAIDHSSGVVLVISQSEYERNDPEMQELIKDMRRERVRIMIVSDQYWESFKHLIEIGD